MLPRLLRACSPLLVAVAAWEVAAFSSDSQFVPHLPAVAQVIVRSAWHDPIIQSQGGGRYGYAPHVWATLLSFLFCFITGSGAGLAVSLAVHPWRPARWAFHSAIRPWQVVPPLIAIPVVFAMVGASVAACQIVGAFYAFISTAVYALAALEEVPRNYLSLAKLGGAGRFWTALHVQLPASLPLLIGPLKVVASFTLGVVVVLEFLAMPEGIGRVMKFAVTYYSIGLLLAGIFWAALIGLAVDVCGGLLTGWLMRWAARSRGGTFSVSASGLPSTGRAA